MFKAIMRIFGYVYHLLLGLFLLIVGAIALFGSNLTLRMDMLPWEDPTLTYVLFFGSLAGLVSLVLAFRGKTRILFRIWTVVVFVVMAYGYFFTRYGFGDADGFRNAVLLTLGALIAVVGAWTKVAKKA
jgi:hypothetical protein